MMRWIMTQKRVEKKEINQTINSGGINNQEPLIAPISTDADLAYLTTN